jgi:hypothetical protein
MIPLYGFLEGDTIGLLVLASEDDTMDALAAKLESAASVRVAPRGGMRVIYKGEMIDHAVTVSGAGIEALDRIDVVEA